MLKSIGEITEVITLAEHQEDKRIFS